MKRHMLLTALAITRAASLSVSVNVDTEPECSHDREAAIRSVRDGTGTLWMFHTTHNAGTSLRQLIDVYMPEAEYSRSQGFSLEPGHWYYESLFGEGGLRPEPLNELVPCDSDNFVSVYPARHPLPRILVHDDMWTSNATANTDKCNTDNYGLRKLLGIRSGVPLGREDIERAKRRLESFDVVLDMATLGDSVGAMCKALGFSDCKLQHLRNGGSTAAHSEEDVLEKVGPSTFAKWKERNAPEIEVYEHAKKLAADFVARNPGASATAEPKNSSRGAATKDEDTSAHTWVC